MLRKLETIHRERKLLTSNTPKLSKNTSGELWLERQRLEVQLERALSLNQNLKETIKASHNNPVNEVQSLYEDYTKLNKDVKTLENKHQLKRALIETFKDSEGKELGRVESIAIIEKINESAKEDYGRLVKYCEILEKSIKTSDVRFRQIYKEYVEAEKKLEQEKTCLHMKILKSKQQQRLLEIDPQSNEGPVSQRYAKVRFLYKPSLKGLYI